LKFGVFGEATSSNINDRSTMNLETVHVNLDMAQRKFAEFEANPPVEPGPETAVAVGALRLVLAIAGSLYSIAESFIYVSDKANQMQQDLSKIEHHLRGK
jgi:hypothetical protein